MANQDTVLSVLAGFNSVSAIVRSSPEPRCGSLCRHSTFVGIHGRRPLRRGLGRRQGPLCVNGIKRIFGENLGRRGRRSPSPPAPPREIPPLPTPHKTFAP